MANTHYYGIFGDLHVRGRRAPAPLTLDQHAGQKVIVVTPPGTPVQIGTILRGTVSGSLARVTRIVNEQEWVIESLPGAAGLPGLAFAQNYNFAGLPNSGETISLDTGGTAVIAPLLVAGQVQPGYAQFLPQHNDAWFNDFVPADQSDTIWYDAFSKRAMVIDLGSVTGTWTAGDRVQTSAGGSFTILYKITSTKWAVMRRLATSLAVSQTITNLTNPGGTATITAVPSEPRVGNWVSFCQMPNGTGINSAGLIGPNLSVSGNDTTTTAPWERIRNGNGTDGGEAGIGPENRLVHRAHAKWQQQADVDDRAIRATNWSSIDAGGATDGLLGGVTAQVVRCTGTFAGGWQEGETVTGPGGWSAKVLGHSVLNKMVFVHATNGATLGAGTITGGTSGATATAEGPAHGWQPGSTHWNNLVAHIEDMLEAPGAKWESGSGKKEPRWEGIALMVWDSEILVHTFGCPAVSAEIGTAQWAALIEALREHLERPELPIAVWKHRAEARGTIAFLGVPASRRLHDVIDALPGLLPRVVVVDSAAYDMAAPLPGAVDDRIWLSTDAYVDLGDDFWRALDFAATEVEPGDWGRVPIVFVLGGEQATGFINGSKAMELDLDPDLWPSTTFPIGVGVDTTDPKCMAWNAQLEVIEPLHVGRNCNGFFGSSSLTCGSEVPLMARFKMRVSADPDESDRCILAKFAVPAASVNARVLTAAATWDPDLTSRPEINVTASVTALPATSSLPARGRLTAAAGTFLVEDWPNGAAVTVRGSALGVLGAGGNNTEPWRTATLRDRATDGSWIELVGPFVAEASRPLILTSGPIPILPELRRQIDLLFADCMANKMIPDPRLIVFEAGEHDLPKASEFEDAFRRFWAAIEPLLSMRGKGEEAIAKVVVKTSKNTPVAVLDADLDLLRTAQTTVAGELANAVVLDPSDLAMEYGGYVRRTNRLQNGLHFSARATITKGFRIDAVAATLGPSKGIPAHPAGELAVDFGSVDGGINKSGSASTSEDTGDKSATTTTAKSIDGAPSAEQQQGLTDAIFTAPDVASYTTPTGQQVQRRSVDDLLKLERHASIKASRQQGPSRVIGVFE